MNAVLWVVAGVLALAFLASGLMKLTQPKDRLSAGGMDWTEDFSPGRIRAIGLLEALGAIGLVLPGLTGIATVLVPLAASGLVLIMLGAAITHVRRHEPQMIVINLVLGAAALVVAWGRFGPHKFVA
jgi:uncharacterized membrane protein YphA (DoxX/SURF4 family)